MKRCNNIRSVSNLKVPQGDLKFVIEEDRTDYLPSPVSKMHKCYIMLPQPVVVPDKAFFLQKKRKKYDWRYNYKEYGIKRISIYFYFFVVYSHHFW